MRRFLAGLIICVALMLFGTENVRAQGLGSLFPSDAISTQEPEALADAIRQAADDGASIIVIGADGRVTTAASPDPVENIDAPAAVEHSALMRAQERAVRFRAALLERLVQLPNATQEVIYILRAASPDGTIMAFVKAFVVSMLLFGVGAIVEREIFGKRIARRFVVARIKDDPKGYTEKMPFLVFRFFMGVIGILVSMLVAYILGAAIYGTLDDTAMQFTVTLINIGYFACRFTAGLWRMILSPFLTQYRIPPLGDRDAKRLHRWMWGIAALDICFILFGMWIWELGLNYEVYAFLASMMSALMVLLNILLVLINHRAISNALRKGKPYAQTSMLIRFLSRAWAPVVIVYVIFAWFELTYDLVLENPGSIPLIAGAYGILISIIVVYGVINYVIERSFARARAIRLINERRAEREAAEHAHAEARAMALRQVQEDGPDEDDPDALLEGDSAAGPLRDRVQAAESARIDAGPGPSQDDIQTFQPDTLQTRDAVDASDMEPRRVLDSFEALARRVAGILAFVAGIYAFFYIWDNDGARMVENYADRMLDIMVIIFIGYVIYHAFRIWIDTKIADETGDEEEGELGDEGSGSSASRLATLLPLFRNFILIVVVVTILLIVLMEIGINVGPLFAGAGIVGVAVGFGSQALVRDIFAGAFFLFDDAFRKGEYLDVGGVKGTVEKISVRSFQLRHHLGALHTIPFGELQVMTNYSRDWVIMKLPLRVTYDTDVEAVRKMIKKLGVALLDDPVIGENFIQPLKSQGVIEMQDSAMIIRVKFMTKPGDQWLVRKRVYEEIRELFQREGIKFAHREVTVRLADGKVEELTEEQRRAVTAATQGIAEAQEAGADNQGGEDR